MHDPVELKDQIIVYAPQSADKAHVGVPLKESKEGEPPLLRVSPHKGAGRRLRVHPSDGRFHHQRAAARHCGRCCSRRRNSAGGESSIAVGWIETILGWFYLLDVRISMAGYMTISLFLLIIWLIALLIFDKQRYITVTPGQVTVCDEIGGGVQMVQHRWHDLAKAAERFLPPYVLGLGSGDLIIRTAGAQATQVDLPNVLFINAKVRQIEQHAQDSARHREAWKQRVILLVPTLRVGTHVGTLRVPSGRRAGHRRFRGRGASGALVPRGAWEPGWY